jgi:hypothetical protein
MNNVSVGKNTAGCASTIVCKYVVPDRPQPAMKMGLVELMSKALGSNANTNAKTPREEKKRECSGADDAFHAVLQDGSVEVEEKAQRQTCDAKVRSNLSIVHFREILDGLQFDHETSADDEVDAPRSDLMTFVQDREDDLPLERNPAKAHLDRERLLVRSLV